MNKPIEETHPSLKGFIVDYSDLNEAVPYGLKYYIHALKVQESTVDKTVLKEKIREFESKIDAPMDAHIPIKDLLKELGIDEE